jgi:hypothetical protein
MSVQRNVSFSEKYRRFRKWNVLHGCSRMDRHCKHAACRKHHRLAWRCVGGQMRCRAPQSVQSVNVRSSVKIRRLSVRFGGPWEDHIRPCENTKALGFGGSLYPSQVAAKPIRRDLKGRFFRTSHSACVFTRPSRPVTASCECINSPNFARS